MSLCLSPLESQILTGVCIFPFEGYYARKHVLWALNLKHICLFIYTPFKFWCVF